MHGAADRHAHHPTPCNLRRRTASMGSRSCSGWDPTSAPWCGWGGTPTLARTATPQVWGLCGGLGKAVVACTTHVCSANMQCVWTDHGCFHGMPAGPNVGFALTSAVAANVRAAPNVQVLTSTKAGAALRRRRRHHRAPCAISVRRHTCTACACMLCTHQCLTPGARAAHHARRPPVSHTR
jgi:hypothetical protein